MIRSAHPLSCLLAAAAVAFASGAAFEQARSPGDPGPPPVRGRGGNAPLVLAAAPGCSASRILDLRGWKLQLPTGEAESPTEILPDALGTVSSAAFTPTRRCDGVRFRAPVNGVTTSGSKNPRSELREMTDGGGSAAAWSSSGTHSIAVREAFTVLPRGKPHLVGLQIHDATDDVSVFRLEGTKLYVTNGDDAHAHLIDPDYRLGTVFDAAYLVTKDTIWAYYNGRPVARLAKSFSGAYFKAGAYTQANCSNASPCSDDNYGETVIHAIRVRHDERTRS